MLARPPAAGSDTTECPRRVAVEWPAPGGGGGRWWIAARCVTVQLMIGFDPIAETISREIKTEFVVRSPIFSKGEKV